MNTQTHVLLAVVLAGSATSALSKTNFPDPRVSSGLLSNALQHPVLIAAIVFGALLPDLSLFVMFGYAVITGVPGSVIWSEMYYSPFWQSAGALTNSIPLYLIAAIAGFVLVKRTQPSALFVGETHPEQASTNSAAIFLYAISIAALLHVITDLPLHHDDGHPHFWPFTDWIYSSPVSYWDAGHYANYWVPIECILGLSIVLLLWLRTKRWWARLLLGIAAFSYIAFPIFFFGRSF